MSTCHDFPLFEAFELAIYILSRVSYPKTIMIKLHLKWGKALCQIKSNLTELH